MAKGLKERIKDIADTAFAALAGPASGYYRGLRLIMDKALSRLAEAELEIPEPQWIVNDLGELGVRVGNRFFLYKGDNLEYGGDDDDVQDGIVMHSDGTPMKYRIVGKREFGEVCYPIKWVREERNQAPYTEELTFIPGLSWGKPEDGEWRPLPGVDASSRDSIAAVLNEKEIDDIYSETNGRILDTHDREYVHRFARGIEKRIREKI